MKNTKPFIFNTKHISFGIFKLLLAAALLCFRTGLRVAGRFILSFALQFVRPNNDAHKMMFVTVFANAKYLDDPKTLALLFAPKSFCVGLGPLLRAVYDLAMGDLDAFVESAELAFEAAPDIDMNKLMKLEKAHLFCTLPTETGLLRSVNFNKNIPRIVRWKEKAFASLAQDNVTLRLMLNERLQVKIKDNQQYLGKRALETALIACECGEFDVADTHLVQDNIGTEDETATIHLHHAVNRHFDRNKSSDFFHPNHFHLLNLRNSQVNHPHIDLLKTQLIKARSRYDVSQLPSVALFCPLHRIENLRSILEQAQNQTTQNTTVYLVINNCDHDIDEDKIRADWRSSSRLKILNFGVMPSLGSVIRQTLDLVTEDFFLKLDADCLYGPNYAADMVGQCISRGAGITVKHAKFRYFSDIGLLDLQFISSANRWFKWGDWAGGSAMAAPTNIWRKYALATRTQVAEDTAFCQNAYFHHEKIYFADPFNHIAIHQSDLSKHTFKQSHLEKACKRDAYTVCRDTVDITTHAFQ